MGNGCYHLTVWSYEPGVVATPMQEAVRGRSNEDRPHGWERWLCDWDLRDWFSRSYFTAT